MSSLPSQLVKHTSCQIIPEASVPKLVRGTSLPPLTGVSKEQETPVEFLDLSGNVLHTAQIDTDSSLFNLYDCAQVLKRVNCWPADDFLANVYTDNFETSIEGSVYTYQLALQPFHERVPFEVLEIRRAEKPVLLSGKLDGAITIKELPGKTGLSNLPTLPYQVVNNLVPTYASEIPTCSLTDANSERRPEPELQRVQPSSPSKISREGFSARNSMILQQMPAKLEDIKRADSPRPPSLSLAQLHGTEGGAKAGMARRGTSTLHVGLQQRSDTSLGRPGLVLYEGAAPLTIHLRSLYEIGWAVGQSKGYMLNVGLAAEFQAAGSLPEEMTVPSSALDQTIAEYRTDQGHEATAFFLYVI